MATAETAATPGVRHNGQRGIYRGLSGRNRGGHADPARWAGLKDHGPLGRSRGGGRKIQKPKFKEITKFEPQDRGVGMGFVGSGGGGLCWPPSAVHFILRTSTGGLRWAAIPQSRDRCLATRRVGRKRPAGGMAATPLELGNPWNANP
jgi:hypothetical protein